MECRQLDVKMIKATDLRDVNLFSKMDVYAIVSISGDSYDRSAQKTPVDKEAGTSPKWNFPMKFSVDDLAAQQNRLVLKIKLICDRTFGDKEIGEVHVPIKELLDAGVNRGDKSEKSVAYNLRRPSGKIKGVVEFSYKFGEKYTVAPPQFPVQKKADDAVMAYPAGYAGTSAGYPPSGGYPSASAAPMGGYPPPPQQEYGYPYAPPRQGYGYPPAPQYGYGYAPPQGGYGYGNLPTQRPQKSKMGAGSGMALGLGAGLLGGLLVGDMISDVGDMASYDSGFGDGFDM